jgi:hypothetical protein
VYIQADGLRKVERPLARWKGEMGKNVRILGIKVWWAAIMNREE